VTEFDEVIPPGGTGKVTASVTSGRFRQGPLVEDVTVKTNDPSHPKVVLQIRAQFLSAIEVWPSNRLFFRGRIAELKPSEVTVSSTDGKPFDILGMTAHPFLTVAIRPADGTDPKGSDDGVARPLASGSSRYVVTVAAKKDVPVGQQAAVVTLATNVPTAESIPLRATLVVLTDAPP
jgi:hypothetical protein